jgi:hypothetical protein
MTTWQRSVILCLQSHSVSISSVLTHVMTVLSNNYELCTFLTRILIFNECLVCDDSQLPRLCSVGDRWVRVECWWDDPDRMGAKYCKRNLSHCHFVLHKSHMVLWDKNKISLVRDQQTAARAVAQLFMMCVLCVVRWTHAWHYFFRVFLQWLRLWVLIIVPVHIWTS